MGYVFFDRYKLLNAMGYTPDALRNAPEAAEQFACLEHIRWCRYHYVNNWRFRLPENGKNKDLRRRIHRDLIPYEDLSDAEKKKDIGQRAAVILA